MEQQINQLTQDLQQAIQRIHQLNQQNQGFQDQINQLQGAVGAAGAAAAGNAAADAILRDCRRAQGSAPSYDGKAPFRRFELEFRNWYSQMGIDRAGVDFAKGALLSCMKGEAAERTKSVQRGTPGFARGDNNQPQTVEGFITLVRSIFQPTEESNLAKSEFSRRKQGKKEPIGAFLSHKLALYESAYPEGERAFSTLLTAVIDGLANDIVKYRLRTVNPQNEGQLRTQCMSIVASEREAYYGKYAQPNQTLDGLAATTQSAHNYEEEDEQMEIDGIQKFNGNCRRCDKYGHKAIDCNVNLEKKKPVDKEKQKKKCANSGCERIVRGDFKTCFSCHKKQYLDVQKKDKRKEKMKKTHDEDHDEQDENDGTSQDEEDEESDEAVSTIRGGTKKSAFLGKRGVKNLW